jgi:hypothetical protein
MPGWVSQPSIKKTSFARLSRRNVGARLGTSPGKLRTGVVCLFAFWRELASIFYISSREADEQEIPRVCHL